jgi:hypothetical protein
MAWTGSGEGIMTKLAAVLFQIDSGSILLPEFQRGYVWNRDQVRGLMRSLYLDYPIGSLLTWETQTDGASVRGEEAGTPAIRVLILDGQQRVTTLYGISRGKPPAFFQGDEKAFTGLRFNIEEEAFEFYAPAKMKDDPRWIDVTGLFAHGLEPFISALSGNPETLPRFATYMDRLNRLKSSLDRDVHEEKIAGSDKTVDVVVDIFNRVNSGGTKLSKGDLALAKMCARWPDARAVMRSHLDAWQDAGFFFSLDWLLRNATAVATGRAEFASLDDRHVDVDDFQVSLASSAQYIGTVLDTVAGRLGLDHDRVLMGRYAFPVISRLLHLRGGRFADFAESDRVLYWYAHSALWGRFAGSTESVLNQDFEIVNRSGIDGLITALERWRGGNLTIDGQDFEGFGRGSRFYPLLYMLTRVYGARDFGSGLPLKDHLLGRLASLQVHHVFPKAVLYDFGYGRSQVNAVANFCFLTQDANLAIGHRRPEEYFEEVEDKHPGALASQWIPLDRALWRVERYPDFLAARRELLANAANSFLGQLRAGTSAPAPGALGRAIVVEAESEQDARARDIAALITELTELGCAEPAVDCEIPDPADGRVLSVAEACWPEGLQPGQGDPVVLELDPEESDIPRLKELGYEVFTTTDSLRGYVRHRNLVASGEATELIAADAEVEAEAGTANMPVTGAVVTAGGGRDGSSPSAPYALSASAESSTPVGSVHENVRAAFERAMKDIYVRAKNEAGYNAAFFLDMLSTLGGLDTAHRLLATSEVSSGFTALYERGRLDLTVEALVTQPQYADLFSDYELEVARQRLRDLGYSPPGTS